MKAPLFTGASVAIVTPMYKDGSVNFSKLGELIEEQIASGTAAITVCGTTGEAATLTDEEKLALIGYTVQTVHGRVPVIAGTGSNNTAHAKRLSKYAEALGADGLLVVTPFYNKCSKEGLIRHYCSIADSVRIPLIAYNVPSRTGVTMDLEVYQKLSRHPNINGIKEASGNLELVRQTVAECGKDLNIWSGNDNQIVPMIRLGAKGVISVLSNVCPKQTALLTKLCLDGAFSEAENLANKLAPLIEALFCEVNPIPVKTALNLMNREVGPLRMPLCEISSQKQEILQKAMVQAGILSA